MTPRRAAPRWACAPRGGSQRSERGGGDSSLSFSTALLPKARQGAAFQVAVIKGRFHGLISAHTPTGWNRVSFRCVGVGWVWPSVRVRISAK